VPVFPHDATNLGAAQNSQIGSSSTGGKCAASCRECRTCPKRFGQQFEAYAICKRLTLASPLHPPYTRDLAGSCADASDADCRAHNAWVTMATEAFASSTSKSGLLVFAGGILIGGAVAAALAYTYSNAYQEERPRNRKSKGNQRCCFMRLHSISGRFVDMLRIIAAQKW